MPGGAVWPPQPPQQRARNHRRITGNNRSQPGFVLHTAFEDSQGLCVSEIWETKDQHDSYFNEHVVPNVPGEIKQEVVELHSVVKP